jgi:hypothetical protein
MVVDMFRALLVVSLVALASCTSAPRPPRRPSLEDLAGLRHEMSLADVKRALGEPVRDVGSGLFVLLYELDDGSTATIGCDGSRVLYVRHGEQELLQ